jgi:hypothetical protein
LKVFYNIQYITITYDQDKLIIAAINRTFVLLNDSIHNNSYKVNEFLQQTVLSDKSLMENEKSEAITEEY